MELRSKEINLEIECFSVGNWKLFLAHGYISHAQKLFPNHPTIWLVYSFILSFQERQ